MATSDRRLAKSHVSVHMGGAAAAVGHYQENPTPNLIIVETRLPRTEMIAERSIGWPSVAMPAPRIKNVVISIADEELLEHICKDVLGCGRLDRDGAVLTSCRQERLHALPRQFIGAFVFDVAGVAAHPVPLNLVALPCGVEPLP